jgi:site-specific recombinase XerD
MDNKRTKIRGVFEKVPSSGVWWICYFDTDGRKRREKVGRKSAAIELYRKRKTEVMEGKKLPEKLRARKVGFAELAKDALEYSRAHKRSFRDDEIRMAKLTDWLRDRPAESVTPQEIERWLSAKSTLKPATLNRYRALLSLVYRLGMQNGKVKLNPARLVRQRKENNGRIRFLSAEEEQALRTVMLEKYLKDLPQLELALHTGLRLSEQFGLTWDCVDFDRRTLTIPLSKNGELRHVPLNDDALAALRVTQQCSNYQPYVFLNRYGQRLVSPRDWFDPAVKAAGLNDFTWHCLRHTFASRLVMAGIDLRTVQELMGHKTIQMTVRYAHLAPKHQLAAVQRLCDTGTAQKAASDTRTDTGISAHSGGATPIVN